jgi:AraC-like DNA-binding protein
LFVILPPTSEFGNRSALFRLMELCRPHSVLPHFHEADPEELVAVLRRFPSQFAVEVTDYLTWRGVEVDLDTRRLLRKTLELSGELRTVSGLARALYMSRRALGRRFMTKGLPVPSHWLHFGRVLRGSLRLQNPSASLLTVGSELGYPDGFAFSNQMKRLTGLRPSMMRECFGWEWVVESWLLKEANSGSLSPGLRKRLFPGDRQGSESMSAAVAGSRFGVQSPIMRVAEDAPESA